MQTSQGLTSSQDADTRPILAVNGLAKAYGGLQAVAGVNLRLEAGGITGLIGPNGAGKTTLVNLLTGIERPDAGAILLDGRDVTSLRTEQLANRGLLRTFQICRPLTRLTVLENLLLARASKAGESVLAPLFQRRKIASEIAAAIAQARTLLEAVGLWQHADALSTELSGGQKKLLEIARILMLKPRVVLLDEPAAGVAPALRQTLIAAIRSLASQGVAVLVIEHDLEVTAALCSHVYVMAAGRILTEGSFAAVTRDRRVIDAYFGAAA